MKKPKSVYIVWITFSLFGRFKLMMVTLFLCVSPVIAGEPKFTNKYNALWYTINWHDIYVRQVIRCPSLKINGYWPFMKLGKTPNWHDEDSRWGSYEKAGDMGAKDGKKAAVIYIKKNGIKNYCQHLVKKYGPDSTIIHAIRSVSLEEKAGFKYRPLNGCKTIPAFVEFDWPCDLDPRAKPLLCKQLKEKQKNNGSCRDNLGVLTNGLKPTGKTHKSVWHEKFTGPKTSGPFIEVEDKNGTMWWVDEIDWQYATEKTKK